MKVVVLGASGFVGSAFVRHLSSLPGLDLLPITRENYGDSRGIGSDAVIEASCNSRKYIADADPAKDFDLSVAHRLRTLLDFPALLHVHVSSVDVYSNLENPANTREDSPIDLGRISKYGFHKLLAEKLVRYYASGWLIIRLAGMVGPGLKKNPVFDILNGLPLRIHPDSRYQYLSTDEAARLTWDLVRTGVRGEVFNLCGQGLIAPRRIAELAGKDLNLKAHPEGERPRIVHADCRKAEGRLGTLPSTEDTIRTFLRSLSR